MVNTDKMTAEIIEELAFSKEDLALLAKARNTPISFDEDCPETIPECALKFRRVNSPRIVLKDGHNRLCGDNRRIFMGK